MDYDLFISYASEDVDEVVIPLCKALIRSGVWHMWYAKREIRIGDSIPKRIEDGLQSARYGLLILSPDYLLKDWTDRERRALLSLKKGLLPIRYKLRPEEITQFWPLLGDTLSLDWTDGLKHITGQIVSVLADDSQTLFNKESDRREENVAFWNLASLFVQHELGLIAPSLEKSIKAMADQFKTRGVTWTAYVSERLGINGEQIRQMRNAFPSDTSPDTVAEIIIDAALNKWASKWFP